MGSVPEQEFKKLEDSLTAIMSAQYALQNRVLRIEESLLFRFLRWVGAAVGYRPQNSGENNAEAAYQRWIEEKSWTKPTREQILMTTADWTSEMPITCVIPAGASSEHVDTTINSAAEQIYRFDSICILYDPSAGDLEARFSEKRTGPLPFHFLRSDAGWLDWPFSGVGYIAIVPAGSVLDPSASFRWAEAIRQFLPELIYSDWDSLSRLGLRHSPRFTPEFSPTLLDHLAYWGDCCVISRPVVSDFGLASFLEPAWPRQLSRRLTARSVIRIPEVLWHRMREPGEAPIPETCSPVLQQESIDAVHPRGAGNEVSVVICTRNPTLLNECLASIRRTTGSTVAIVVVAHACGSEREIELVARRYNASCLNYSGAFHFGIMNELGIEKTSSPVVILMNDDVRPLVSDWLEIMTRCALRQEVGIVGALLLYPDHTIQHAGIGLGFGFGPSHPARRQKASELWPWLLCTRELSAVTGACLGFRRRVWDDLGGFDRRFPVNYNDVDLCLRARRAGYSVILESSALMVHQESQTRRAVVKAGEWALFAKKWGREIAAPDPFFSPNLALRNEQIVPYLPWSE